MLFMKAYTVRCMILEGLRSCLQASQEMKI